jgi:hypothetical protein
LPVDYCHERKDRIALLDLEPFNRERIEMWLERWDSAVRDSGLPAPDVGELMNDMDLRELAATPILLLMVAVTWGKTTKEGDHPFAARSSLYEEFFRHIARGKYDADPQDHGVVLAAGQRLARILIDADIITDSGDERDNAVEAMLYMMSRVAWEVHKDAYGDARGVRLDRFVWETQDRLELPPSDWNDLITPGLVLALQVNSRGSGSEIVFGHKSFREFLVARFFTTTLRRLMAGDGGRVEADLYGRMIRPESEKDKSELFLLGTTSNWDASEREALVRWCSRCVANDRLANFSGVCSIAKDTRNGLREVAMQLCAWFSDGPDIDEPLLKGMLAVAWVQAWQFRVHARRANLPGAHLPGAHLHGADLQDADLQRADLQGARLERAHLERAHLERAHLERAHLERAYLQGAYLQQARLRQARLQHANLQDANLQGAELQGADLQHADLQGANLRRADLGQADLQGANLQGANLQGANLYGAHLQGASWSGLSAPPMGWEFAPSAELTLRLRRRQP